jgi:hypothetical protein
MVKTPQETRGKCVGQGGYEEGLSVESGVGFSGPSRYVNWFRGSVGMN